MAYGLEKLQTPATMPSTWHFAHAIGPLGLMRTSGLDVVRTRLDARHLLGARAALSYRWAMLTL
jgi:hypothetical protein